MKRSRPATPEEIEQVVQMRAEGASIDATAEYFKRSATWVRSALRKSGVAKRGRPRKVQQGEAPSGNPQQAERSNAAIVYLRQARKHMQKKQLVSLDPEHLLMLLALQTLEGKL